MPKEFTHIHIAKSIVEELKKKGNYDHILSENNDYFLLGSILPDTPAYLNWGKNRHLMKEIDEGFHDSSSQTFHGFLNILKNADGNINQMTALSMGALSHIVTDSIFHPMVYYFSGTEKIGTHFTIETAIDQYFLGKNNFNLLKLKNQLNLKIINKRVVYDFLATFFLNDKSKIKIMKSAFKTQLLYQSLFTKKRTRLLLKAINNKLSLGLDDQIELFYKENIQCFINEDEISYLHPITGTPLFDTLETLKSKAVFETVAIITELTNLSDTEDKMNKILSLRMPNLLTGMCGVKLKASKYFKK